MKPIYFSLIISITFLSNFSIAQAWKKTLTIVGATSAVTAVITAVSLSNASKNPEVGDSETQEQSKRNLVQIEEEFYEYLLDYNLGLEKNQRIEPSKIKQPYIREIILKLIENDEFIVRIEESRDEDINLEKINLLISESLKTKI